MVLGSETQHHRNNYRICAVEFIALIFEKKLPDGEMSTNIEVDEIRIFRIRWGNFY